MFSYPVLSIYEHAAQNLIIKQLKFTTDNESLKRNICVDLKKKKKNKQTKRKCSGSEIRKVFAIELHKHGIHIPDHKVY